MDNFILLYHNVFNDDGSVKSCGRDACAKLILAAQTMTDDYCGNPETGIMNIAVIKSLVERT